MEYRILGRTGLKVGAIALGCEGFTDKTAEEVRADFDFAIRNGINFLDLYASNPTLRSNIGAALAGRREKFVIQGHLCSVWEEGQYLRTRDPEKSLAAFEDMLARLGTDYVEIGMIHYVDAEADLREVLDGPIMRLAQRLRSEGRIRHIGLSSHNPVVAHMAARTGLIDVLMFSVNPCYDLLPPSDDVDTLWADESYARELHNIDPERQRLYEFCEREGIAIDVMKAYGGGDLLSDANSPFGRPMTPVQCLEYALTRPGVAAVMAGCRSREEMQAALDWCSATAAERDYTGALAGLDKFSWEGHCMYCGHCAPCSGGDRHRRCEQILQPDPGTARDTGDGARTLQAPAAPRLGVHRLRPLRTELPVRRRHHRPHAAGGGKVRILTPQARNGAAVRTRHTRNRHAFHGVPFSCGGSATISYLCNPTRPE